MSGPWAPWCPDPECPASSGADSTLRLTIAALVDAAWTALDDDERDRQLLLERLLHDLADALSADPAGVVR